MAISLKHAFASAKGDPADATLVRPSNWNAEHVITFAANILFGKGVGAGTAEEIPCTAFARSILASADLAALLAAIGLGGFSAGDIKPTLKTVADTGWVMCDDGTIGNALSAASNRANADTWPLYSVLYASVSDTYAAVSGGRTTAAADYALNKTIALTKMLGRALAAAGAGSGLTVRALGNVAGAESNVVTIAQGNIPSYTLPHNLRWIINGTFNTFSPAAGGTPYAAAVNLGGPADGTITSGGSGTPITIPTVTPTSFVNFMLRL